MPGVWYVVLIDTDMSEYCMCNLIGCRGVVWSLMSYDQVGCGQMTASVYG